MFLLLIIADIRQIVWLYYGYNKVCFIAEQLCLLRMMYSIQKRITTFEAYNRFKSSEKTSQVFAENFEMQKRIGNLPIGYHKPLPVLKEELLLVQKNHIHLIKFLVD